MIWITAAAVVTVMAALVASLRVRRYSPTHVAVTMTVGGRGLYLSRTADGLWWKLRLRRRCAPHVCGDRPEPPSGGAGLREPRRPAGPGPGLGAVGLDEPA